VNRPNKNLYLIKWYTRMFITITSEKCRCAYAGMPVYNQSEVFLKS